MTDETERLARMEEQMRAVMEALGRIEAGQKEDSERIAKLEQAVSMGQGALKAFAIVGGIIVGIAGIVGSSAAFLNFMKH